MIEPYSIYCRALANARAATRAGDYAAADKWTGMAERHLAMHERLARIRKINQPSPSGPVMLDPNGFSPGGTPNWVLNQQRLERSRTRQRNPWPELKVPSGNPTPPPAS